MTPTLTKQFIIEIDVLSGEIDYKNLDDLTYFQVMGMIEYAKLMITKEFLNECND